MAWTCTVRGIDGTQEVESSRGPRGSDPGDCHCWIDELEVIVRGLIESMGLQTDLTEDRPKTACDRP